MQEAGDAKEDDRCHVFHVQNEKIHETDLTRAHRRKEAWEGACT